MKHRAWFQRLLSLTLCLLLCVGWFPTAAFADEATEGGDSSEPVAAAAGESKTVSEVTYSANTSESAPEPAVSADGEGASVTVEKDVDANVSAETPHEIGEEGYNGVSADNGGSVAVKGNVDVDVTYEEDYLHYGQSSCISGVKVDNDTTATVGGDVTVDTGMDPYLGVLPDTEKNPDWWERSMLDHHSIGVNNEGGKATVDGSVTVTDSQYGIGVDAGKKYEYDDAREAVEDYFYNLESEDVPDFPEEVSENFTKNLAKYISAIAASVKLGTVSSVNTGDITAKGGMYSKGMYVRSNGDVHVDGDVVSGNLDLPENVLNSPRRRDSYEYYAKEYWRETDEEIEAALQRTLGLHNQGIVAQGYAGNLSDDTRQKIYEALKKIYGEDHHYGEYAGLGNFVPCTTETFIHVGDEGNEFIDMMAKAVMAVGDHTYASVSGDVTAYGAKVTKGVTALDAEVDVGGKVSAEGTAAAGVLAVGDEAKIKAGSVEATGTDTAAGIASFGGETEVSGEVVVQSEKAGTGIVLSAGNVKVDSDVTVKGDETTGIKTIPLDNRLLTIMGMSEDYWGESDPLFMESIWNCINRYSDEMNTGDILAHFLTEDATAPSVVVDGTVTAKNGITVVDNAMMAKIVEDYVVNVSQQYFYSDEDLPDPRAMSDEELKQAAKEASDAAESLNREDYQYWWQYSAYQRAAGLYKACLEIRKIGAEESEDPDVTVWRIDAEDEVVRHGTDEFSWKDFLSQWTFILGGDLGFNAAKTWDSTVTVNYNNDGAADRMAQNINYIIRIGSVAGGKGNISLQGARAHKGFDTGREGEEIIIYVSHDDGYEIESVSAGEFATLTKNADGSYTLKVPAGGGVQIDAVLKAIEKPQDDTPTVVVPVEPEKPTVVEPEKPATEEPTIVEPEEPTIEEPEKPATEEPTIVEPEEPTIEESEESATEEPTTVKPEKPAATVASLKKTVSVAKGMKVGLVLSGEDFVEGSTEDLLWQEMKKLDGESSYYSMSYLGSKDAEEQSKNIEKFVAEGYGLILCADESMKDLVKQAAEKYPNQKFAVLSRDDLNLANVACVAFADQEQAAVDAPTASQLRLALRDLCQSRRENRLKGGIHTYDTAD